MAVYSIVFECWHSNIELIRQTKVCLFFMPKKHNKIKTVNNSYMIIAFVRTIILYISVMLAMKLMGKRQLGEMQPMELIVTIMISDMASVPMQNTGIPLLNGIVPIFTIAFLEIFFSFLALKSKKSKEILVGKPSILIKNGKVNKKEMESLRFTLDDLKEEIRKKDIQNIEDVALAILETDGGFSAFPKDKAAPLTKGDVKK